MPRKRPKSLDAPVVTQAKMLATINSYLGFLQWCSAYRLRKEICEKVRNSRIGIVLVPSEDGTKVTIRPRYTNKHYYRTEYLSTKKTNRQHYEEVWQNRTGRAAGPAELSLQHSNS